MKIMKQNNYTENVKFINEYLNIQVRPQDAVTIVVERGDDYQTIPKTRHYHMNGQLISEGWSEDVLGPDGLLYRSYSCDGNIEYEQRLDPDGVFRTTYH